LAYGAGGAALVLAMAMNTNLLKRINKIAFVECEEVVGKALAHITKNKESSEDSKPWLASPVVTVLETRAIMIKMSAEVVGSVLKKTNESMCACPVISVCNLDLQALLRLLLTYLLCMKDWYYEFRSCHVRRRCSWRDVSAKEDS
jgi:hypothetical protein